MIGCIRENGFKNARFRGFYFFGIHVIKFECMQKYKFILDFGDIALPFPYRAFLMANLPVHPFGIFFVVVLNIHLILPALALLSLLLPSQLFSVHFHPAPSSPYLLLTSVA